jgi:hypothetical protein
MRLYRTITLCPFRCLLIIRNTGRYPGLQLGGDFFWFQTDGTPRPVSKPSVCGWGSAVSGGFDFSSLFMRPPGEGFGNRCRYAF